MRTIEDILRTKRSKVCSIAPDATVYESLKRMAKGIAVERSRLENEVVVEP